jgi:hypothetical protein
MECENLHAPHRCAPGGTDKRKRFAFIVGTVCYGRPCSLLARDVRHCLCMQAPQHAAGYVRLAVQRCLSRNIVTVSCQTLYSR